MKKPLSEYKLFQLLKDGGSSHSINFNVDVGEIAPFNFKYHVVDEQLQCQVTFLGQGIYIPEDVTEDKFRIAADMFEEEGA